MTCPVCGKEFCAYDPANAIPFDGTWRRDGPPRPVNEGEYYVDPVHGDVVMWLLRGGSCSLLQVVVRQRPERNQ